MMTRIVMMSVLLTIVGVAAYHHWGWEGLGILAAVWLMMPYVSFQLPIKDGALQMRDVDWAKVTHLGEKLRKDK